MTARATRDYLVLDYGADPTGKRDSTYALQAAIAATQGPGGPGVLELPPGTFSVQPSALNITGALHLRGAGRQATTLTSSSSTAGQVLLVSSLEPCELSDCTIEAGGSLNGLVLQPPSEAPVPHVVRAVTASASSGPAFVDNGADDVSFLDCIVPGDPESSPTSTGYALSVNCPNGAVRVRGGSLPGNVSAEAQQFSAESCTLGPISSAAAGSLLSVRDCRIYWGGPGGVPAVNGGTLALSTIIDGCYVVTSGQVVSGELPAGGTVDIRNTIVSSSSTSGNIYGLQALASSGSGTLRIAGVTFQGQGTATFVALNNMGTGTITTDVPLSAPLTANPAGMAYATAGSLAANGSTQIELTATRTLQGGMTLSSSTASIPYALVVPVAGTYFVCGQIKVTPNSSSPITSVFVNQTSGGTTTAVLNGEQAAASDAYLALVVTGIVTCAAGDSLTLVGEQQSSSTGTTALEFDAGNGEDNFLCAFLVSQ